MNGKGYEVLEGADQQTYYPDSPDINHRVSPARAAVPQLLLPGPIRLHPHPS